MQAERRRERERDGIPAAERSNKRATQIHLSFPVPIHDDDSKPQVASAKLSPIFLMASLQHQRSLLACCLSAVTKSPNQNTQRPYNNSSITTTTPTT
jgi:hypothetical protein